MRYLGVLSLSSINLTIRISDYFNNLTMGNTQDAVQNVEMQLQITGFEVVCFTTAESQI